MPKVIITPEAMQGMEKCRTFLDSRTPEAAINAAKIIGQHIDLLEKAPAAGRPLEDLPELKELIIPFGDSGYVTLYHFNPGRDEVVLLVFKHQKEAGY